MPGHILYLDDDQALVFLVSKAVTRLGHRASGFTSAPEALDAFTKQPRDFDLVLTDMSMYGMSGLEFAQQVLRIDPHAAVVIATGCEDPNWADHARACGVREVIAKPTTLEAMTRAISGLLHHE